MYFLMCILHSDTSPFGPVTFQLLERHLRRVASISNSAALYYNYVFMSSSSPFNYLLLKERVISFIILFEFYPDSQCVSIVICLGKATMSLGDINRRIISRRGRLLASHAIEN